MSPPAYKTGQKGLVAQWKGKMYPIEIIKHWPFDGVEHSYEVRWTGFKNTAKRGQLPTNESTYGEKFIHPEGTAPQKLRASAKAKAPGVKASGLSTRTAKATTAQKTTRAKAVATVRRAGAAAANDLAAPMTTIQSPAVKIFEIRIGQKAFTKEHKWQYFDNTKSTGPWHDYDFGSSDTVEEAYEDWTANPEVDVRSVKSGRWEYMLDFNQMEQQNVQHQAHTKRKVRRVTVKDGTEAMEESKKINARMALSRKASQSKQTEGETQSSLARTASVQKAARAAAGAAAVQQNWKTATKLEDIVSGQRVQIAAEPSTEYGKKFYPKDFLGQEGMVSTIYGTPPVLVHVGAKSYWFFWQDLLVPNLPQRAPSAAKSDAGSAK